MGAFRKMFTESARTGEPTGRARLDFTCLALGSTPGAVWALQVFGHQGNARLVALRERQSGGFQARGMGVVMAEEGNGDGGQARIAPKPRVAFFRAEVSTPVVQAAFDSARAAVAARVTIGEQPFDPTKGVRVDPITTSSTSVAIELQVEDGQGHRAARAFGGYLGSTSFSDRVPLEIAWRALEKALPQKNQRAASVAESEDRTLVREVWRSEARRPPFAEQALLALTAEAGDREAIPFVTPDLESPLPRTQTLAVDALAAITGWDVRQDAEGKARPLADVVADYRRECVSAP